MLGTSEMGDVAVQKTWFLASQDQEKIKKNFRTNFLKYIHHPSANKSTKSTKCCESAKLWGKAGRPVKTSWKAVAAPSLC